MERSLKTSKQTKKGTVGNYVLNHPWCFLLLEGKANFGLCGGRWPIWFCDIFVEIPSKWK
jgi:hypothetical protein